MREGDQGTIRVLVVEDDPRMLSIVTRHLERFGYDVRGASGGVMALEALDKAPADIILSDIRMPGMDGHTLLQVVKERFVHIKVVLMTAFGNVEDAVDAVKAGAYSYVCKPFKVEEIAAVLRNASREIALSRQVEGLHKAGVERFGVDRIIGRSQQMQDVRAAIKDAAGVNAPVLISGRSGTGKELAARAIHFEGPRAAGPFVPVNCAAIPQTLFESSMFGHARGAFTGADKEQMGLIQQSNGGTLFLDEVGEIPALQQAKLLRVLQEEELRPLGSNQLVKVNLRVICATNQSLEAMVRREEFREDLYYRINVLRVMMPELSSRREDIPVLANHLLAEIARKQGYPNGGISEEAQAALKRHHWSGNVRELRNCLERAILKSSGARVELTDIPPEITKLSPAPVLPGRPALNLSAGRTLADVEKTHIEAILLECDWNRTAAAEILGIDRRTLFSKIKRYGLVGHLKGGN